VTLGVAADYERWAYQAVGRESIRVVEVIGAHPALGYVTLVVERLIGDQETMTRLLHLYLAQLMPVNVILKVRWL
jgi:hypothetical protein